MSTHSHGILLKYEQHSTVKADVVDVQSGKELTTNDFRFTWCDEEGPSLSRRVVPKTYQGIHRMLCLIGFQYLIET